jgi:hypothetical protein
MVGNPWCSRIWQISEPERTRNLPNLDLRDKDFVVEPLDDFRRVRRFEEKADCLNQVCSRLFNRPAFTGDIELWT